MKNTIDFSMDRTSLVRALAEKFNIKEKQATNVAEFLEGEDDLDTFVEEIIFDFYLDSGKMPYGTAKARTGDPQEWMFNELSREFDL